MVNKIVNGETGEEIPAIKEAKRIAKKIGGHIPERVVDDGLLNRI